MWIRHYSGCTQSADYWDEYISLGEDTLHALANAAIAQGNHMVGLLAESGRILYHAGEHTDWHVVLGPPPETENDPYPLDEGV